MFNPHSRRYRTWLEPEPVTPGFVTPRSSGVTTSSLLDPRLFGALGDTPNPDSMKEGTKTIGAAGAAFVLEVGVDASSAWLASQAPGLRLKDAVNGVIYGAVKDTGE